MNARRWILRVLIFGITFAAFARLMHCPFTLWDDEETLSENPRLNPPTWGTLKYYWTTAGDQETMGLYVPVTYTAWAALAEGCRLLHLSNGPNAGVFHTANVVLHSVTSVLVFEFMLVLCLRLPRLAGVISDDITAAIATLVFALHPVQVEPVAWASGTKDLLCGFFAMASLLMYVQSGRSRMRYGLAVVLFVLAMLSKPTAMVVPAMAGVISLFWLRRSLGTTIVSLLPWIVLAVPCAIVTQVVQNPQWRSPLPVWESPLVAADAVAFYMGKLVWPLHLCIDYGRNPPAIAANHQIYFTWIVPTVVTALALWRFKRPQLAAALALFILPLTPVLGFAPFDFQKFSTTADHYLYLPMLGVSVAAALLLRQSKMHIVVIVIIALLIILSVRQEDVWTDTKSLFTQVININPKSLSANLGLGYLNGRDAMQLKNEGKVNQARKLFDESTRFYEQSLRIDPMSIPAMVNIALNDRETGQDESCRSMIQSIVHLQTQLPKEQRADAATLANLIKQFTAPATRCATTSP